VRIGNRTDLCHRSAAAYPRQLHVRAAILLTFRACSGAVAANITTSSRYGEVPQDQWVDARTNLITISIGGNDAGFATVVPACLLDLLPCTPSDPLVSLRITHLATVLPGVFEALKQRAPHSLILVLGYPDIFPSVLADSQSCDLLTFFKHGIGHTTLAGLRGVAHELDEVIAAAARSAGVEYVNIESSFAGHELCTAQPWVNGLELPYSGSFHPNALGQRELAALVSAAINVRLR
jgi:lysophospholipase L1-like esterase